MFVGIVWIWSHPKDRPIDQAKKLSSCLEPPAKKALPGFQTTRDLAVNHWIGEEDLDWSATGTNGAQKSQVIYHYTSCAIKAGDRVTIPEIRPLPQVEPASGHIAYPLLLLGDNRLPSTLNAGSRLDIWEDPGFVAREIVVLAVQCKSGSPRLGNDCSAILDAAPDDVSRLQKADPKSLVIVMRKLKP